MKDVLLFHLQPHVQHQEPDASHIPHAHRTQCKLVAFKELMEFASGTHLHQLPLIQTLLHQHRFAD